MIEGKGSCWGEGEGIVQWELTEILDLGIVFFVFFLILFFPKCGHACHFWYLLPLPANTFHGRCQFVKGREVVTRSQVHNTAGGMG